jgi:hypothetical protein
MKRILLLAASFFLLMGMSAQERRADGAGYERKVVVEELTGTACGWCPRGLVGMKMLRDLYGDRFIGVAVHQFNATDPMYTPDYADIDWSDGGSKGAPCCMIDRNGEIIDPFYGSAGGMRDVAKDFGYKGNWNYRLNSTEKTALRFKRAQLEDCLHILQRLDTDLKSSKLDADLLMQKALCELALAGRA